MLQYVAVCCSVLQYVAVCCSLLQSVMNMTLIRNNTTEFSRLFSKLFVRACCRVKQCVTACRSVLQCVAVCCSVLQCVAVCCSVWKCVYRNQLPLQRIVFQCVMQCAAVCCSMLQYVAVCHMYVRTSEVRRQISVASSASYLLVCVAVRCSVS